MRKNQEHRAQREAFFLCPAYACRLEDQPRKRGGSHRNANADEVGLENIAKEMGK